MALEVLRSLAVTSKHRWSTADMKAKNEALCHEEGYGGERFALKGMGTRSPVGRRKN